MLGELWDRLENETAVAFEAFETYRDMGYQRSLAKVGTTLGKSAPLMERWSAGHRWVERVDAWDRQLERDRADRRRADLARMEDRLVKQSDRVLEAFEEWLTKLTPAKLAKLSPAQAVLLWDKASKLGLLALGGSTENVSVAGNVEVKVSAARKILENPEAAEHVFAALHAATRDDSTAA